MTVIFDCRLDNGEWIPVTVPFDSPEDILLWLTGFAHVPVEISRFKIVSE